MRPQPNPPAGGFPYPSYTVDARRLLAALAACQAAKVRYGLGSKAPSLSSPATGFKAIDCSGFVRWALYQATGGQAVIPDGSVQQREFFASAKFKRSTPEACVTKDGVVRIAFLSPADGGGVGHVVLALNGQTIESHGGVGPDSRPWGSQGWMAKTVVYVLTRPEGG